MRQEGAEGIESAVDALHATPLVGIGDLSPDFPLLFHDRGIRRKRIPIFKGRVGVRGGWRGRKTRGWLGFLAWPTQLTA